MPRYNREEDGTFNGSTGDGKDAAPTPAPPTPIPDPLASAAAPEVDYQALATNYLSHKGDRRCANCGAPSQTLAPVYWQSTGEVELYCRGCAGDHFASKRAARACSACGATGVELTPTYSREEHDVLFYCLPCTPLNKPRDFVQEVLDEAIAFRARVEAAKKAGDTSLSPGTTLDPAAQVFYSYYGNFDEVNALLKNPNLSLEIDVPLGGHPSPRVRAMLARRLQHRPAAFKELARSREHEVLQALADNPTLDPETRATVEAQGYTPTPPRKGLLARLFSR